VEPRYGFKVFAACVRNADGSTVFQYAGCGSGFIYFSDAGFSDAAAAVFNIAFNLEFVA
jgi:hypothetical protein